MITADIAGFAHPGIWAQYSVEHKERLVELLLCSSVDCAGNIFGACVDLDCIELEDDAQACRFVATNFEPHYDTACIEAAYHIIKSEPELVKRWIGDGVQS